MDVWRTAAVAREFGVFANEAVSQTQGLARMEYAWC